jgi:hypothetical protein
MTINKIPLREMQALNSQIHHKEKIKKILKSMLIFPKDPPTMKETIREEMMTSRNLILLIRTTRMSSKYFFHHEYHSQSSTKISFLAIFFLQ